MRSSGARSWPTPDPAEGGDIAGVLFDLDDTLYPQASWLTGAWSAVATHASTYGVDAAALTDALLAISAQGTDRGGIIDRALEVVGADIPVLELVAAFRSYRPVRLEPFPGVPAALTRLRAVAPLGLVTDGDVGMQQGKLAALGLGRFFDVVVISDELGRSHRKPDPAPFRLALDRLGLPAENVVFVGDRPDKDVVGAMGVGMRVIRVGTGEYAHVADRQPPWMTVPTASDAVSALESVMAPRLATDTRRRQT